MAMSADVKSIVEFAQKLVQIPSQGGIDSPGNVVEEAYAFAESLGLPAIKLVDDQGKPIALVAEIKGAFPGKIWAVNATLDTAPAGDAALWKDNPFSGKVQNDVLYGRGAGDSKLAASMFMHLTKEMMAEQANMHGNLLLILDGDEHTGNFGGIKAAFMAGYQPDGIMIGYPGDDKFVVGSRGFARYEIALTGKGAHSGATLPAEDNALVRAADIVQSLTTRPLPQKTEPDFPRPPKVTVTQVEGGDGYSVVPATAKVRVDVRLTPVFNEAAADAHIRQIVAGHDSRHQVPENRATKVGKVSSEPAFLTPETSELRQALRAAVVEITGQTLPEVISGPSNIGNFLATQGIDVIAGYGVPAHGVHAVGENASLKPLGKVYDVYRKTLQNLLKT
ncbi:MAG: M20 family peptidase [Alphaproteobacteria bacterium]|nr:MAG: M20 family peptidase [Alphaproteobacteria bacterium]